MTTPPGRGSSSPTIRSIVTSERRGAHADELVVEDVGRHPDQLQLAPSLAQHLVAGGERDRVGEALHGDGVAVADERAHAVCKAHDVGHGASPVAPACPLLYTLSQCVRKSRLSAPARPASRWRCCSRARASSASCSRRARGSTWSLAYAPGCSSRTPSTCCAAWASRSASTARGSSTPASTCAAAGAGTTST